MSIHKEQSWFGAKLLKPELHLSTWNMEPSTILLSLFWSFLYTEKVYKVQSLQVIHPWDARPWGIMSESVWHPSPGGNGWRRYASLDLFEDLPNQREIVRSLQEWTTCTLPSSPFSTLPFRRVLSQLPFTSNMLLNLFYLVAEDSVLGEALDRWCSYIRPDAFGEDFQMWQ